MCGCPISALFPGGMGPGVTGGLLVPIDSSGIGLYAYAGGGGFAGIGGQLSVSGLYYAGNFKAGHPHSCGCFLINNLELLHFKPYFQVPCFKDIDISIRL